MTREQKIEAYTMLVDGKSCQEIADAFGVDVAEVRAALRAKVAKPEKAPAYEELANICVYPGLAQVIRENELTAKALYLALHPGADAKGFLTWVRPRLIGKSEIKTSEWLALSEAYEVSLDTLMKPDALVA